MKCPNCKITYTAPTDADALKIAKLQVDLAQKQSKLDKQQRELDSLRHHARMHVRNLLADSPTAAEVHHAMRGGQGVDE